MVEEYRRQKSSLRNGRPWVLPAAVSSVGEVEDQRPRPLEHLQASRRHSDGLIARGEREADAVSVVTEDWDNPKTGQSPELAKLIGPDPRIASGASGHGRRVT